MEGQQRTLQRRAPGPHLFGDALAVRIQHLARVATLHQRSGVQPPDFIAQRLQQIQLVRNQQHRAAAASEPSDSGQRPGTHQSIVLGERMFQQQQIHGRELQRVQWAQVAPLAFRDHFSGLRLRFARCQTQQRGFAGAFLADDADHRATGS